MTDEQNKAEKFLVAYSKYCVDTTKDVSYADYIPIIFMVIALASIITFSIYA